MLQRGIGVRRSREKRHSSVGGQRLFCGVGDYRCQAALHPRLA